MKIYIAGKITGDESYKQKFDAAVEYVEKNMEAVAISPAALPGGMTKADYMRICFAMIDSADLVLFLPDWEDSPGARLEMQYCIYTEKRRMMLGQDADKAPAGKWRERNPIGWSILQMIVEDVALRERVKELEARLAVAKLMPATSRETDIARRLAEREEMELKIKTVSGYSLERILELFAAGFALRGEEHDG